MGVAHAREVLSDRLTLLIGAAGSPPLKQIASNGEKVLRRQDSASSISAQRVSDWRRGKRVPAQFEVFSAVVVTLIRRARALTPVEPVAGLYDPSHWYRWWEDALNSPAAAQDPIIGVGAPPEPPPPLADSDGLCPYMGLRSYGAADRELFHGRDRSVGQLLELVSTIDPGSSRVVLLLGASGAGKSSLLAAGVRPAVEQGRLTLDGSTEWNTVSLVPNSHPMQSLTTALPMLMDVPHRCGPLESETSLIKLLGPLFNDVPRIFLVVDSTEEIFGMCDDEPERVQFLRVLHALGNLRRPNGDAVVVIVMGMRAEFFTDSLRYRELARTLTERSMVLDSMTTTELREAVTLPARCVGLRFEPGLIDLLMHEIGDTRIDSVGAGALPLISHVLAATWRNRRAGRLTMAGYRSAGGVRGSVEATAEMAWSKLDEAGQVAAKFVLMRLVHIGEGARDTRARVCRADLLTYAPDATAAEAALEVLTASRLVSADQDFVQFTHEAVLETWARLAGWIDIGREENLARQRLERDSKEWMDRGRDSTMLYHGGRLESARAVRSGHVMHQLTRIADEFVDASTRVADRSRRARLSVFAMLVVLTFVSATTAVVAFSSRTEAVADRSMISAQRDNAVFAQVRSVADDLTLSDPSLSARLSVVAHDLRPDDPRTSADLVRAQDEILGAPVLAHSSAIYGLALRSDGHLLASASNDRTVKLWATGDHTPLSQVGPSLDSGGSFVSSVAFSPDGRLLFSGNGDGTIREWDVSDPTNPAPVGEPVVVGGGAVFSLAAAPSGAVLATADDDGSVRLFKYDKETGLGPIGSPLVGHTGAVRVVAFSPDARTLASGGEDRTVRLWNVMDPSRALPSSGALSGFDNTTHSLAFTADNRTLAAGTDSGTIRLIDTSNPSAPRIKGIPLSGHSAGLWALTFNPAGTLLASGSWDGTARLWDVTGSDADSRLLSGSTGGVLAVQFSASGNELITGEQDGDLRVWNLATSSVDSARRRTDLGGTIGLWQELDPSLGNPAVGDDSAWLAVAASPDRSTLISVRRTGGAVQLWDVADPAAPTPLGPPLMTRTRFAEAAAFSSDGQIMATEDDDHSIRLWDIKDRRSPIAIGEPLTGPSDVITDIVFSPDDKSLAAAGNDHAAWVWDLSGVLGPDGANSSPAIGRPLRGHRGSVEAVAFSPDGHTVATAGDDQTIRLWDVSVLALPRPKRSPLVGHVSTIRSLAFSPDGKTLISSGDDHTVRAWVAEGTDEDSESAVIATPTSVRIHVSYDPTGSVLAYFGDDLRLHVLTLGVNQSINRICSATGGLVTETVWRQHFADLPYQASCLS